MRRKFSVLSAVENKQSEDQRNDGTFLLHLQAGLLMALKEQDYLTDHQLEAALEKLRRRYPSRNGSST